MLRGAGNPNHQRGSLGSYNRERSCFHLPEAQGNARTIQARGLPERPGVPGTDAKERTQTWSVRLIDGLASPRAPDPLTTDGSSCPRYAVSWSRPQILRSQWQNARISEGLVGPPGLEPGTKGQGLLNPHRGRGDQTLQRLTPRAILDGYDDWVRAWLRIRRRGMV
jgi:hypothetical protein